VVSPVLCASIPGMHDWAYVRIPVLIAADMLILANRVQWLSADQKNPSPVVHVLIAQTWVIPSGSRGGIVGVGASARHRRSVTSNGAVVKPGGSRRGAVARRSTGVCRGFWPRSAAPPIRSASRRARRFPPVRAPRSAPPAARSIGRCSPGNWCRPGQHSRFPTARLRR
jgi:hypothetical protein